MTDRQNYLLELSDVLKPLGTPEAILHAATALLRERLSANRCLYYDLDKDHYVIQCDSCEGVPSLVGRYPTRSFGSSLFERHIGGASPMVVNNIHDAYEEDEQSSFSAIQVAAYIGVTLTKHDRFVPGRLTPASPGFGPTMRSGWWRKQPKGPGVPWKELGRSLLCMRVSHASS